MDDSRCSFKMETPQSHFSSEPSPNQPHHHHHDISETTLTPDESDSESHRQWDVSICDRPCSSSDMGATDKTNSDDYVV